MFTFIHPLIDACSAAVLFSDGNSFERWFLYNVLAFALEFPLGVVLDVKGEWLKRSFTLGCGLVVAGVIVVLSGGGGWVPLVMATIGNALFHVTAGKWILDEKPGRNGSIGLFISTGALGLAAGTALGRAGCLWPMAIIAAALVGGAARWHVVTVNKSPDTPLRARGTYTSAVSGEVARPIRIIAQLLLIGGLFALIVWRGWAGLFAGAKTAEAGSIMMIAMALATWVGKASGGYFADLMEVRLRHARWMVVTISVAGSAVLCFVGSPTSLITWLPFVFIAQLATAPVLLLARDVFGGRSGTAFGFNSLGLFAGSLI